MILNDETFARIQAMNPQYDHVAYTGACDKGVHFVVSNNDHEGMTSEAERVIVTEDFVEVERRPIWRCGYKDGVSYQGNYPIAGPPSTLALARRSGISY